MFVRPTLVYYILGEVERPSSRPASRGPSDDPQSEYERRAYEYYRDVNRNQSM